MAKDESNKEDHDSKRQRVGDPSAAQRQAFNEDMELIRSAMNSVSGTTTQDISAHINNTNTESTAQQITQQSSQHAAQGGDMHQRSTGDDNPMDGSDDEEGNWMQNYTPHHTRVGADYQVAELPAPPPNNVASAATISGRVSPTSGGSRDSIER